MCMYEVSAMVSSRGTRGEAETGLDWVVVTDPSPPLRPSLRPLGSDSSDSSSLSEIGVTFRNTKLTLPVRPSCKAGVGTEGVPESRLHCLDRSNNPPRSPPDSRLPSVRTLVPHRSYRPGWPFTPVVSPKQAISQGRDPNGEN